jgi:molybdopterin synthase catalytic subunit
MQIEIHFTTESIVIPPAAWPTREIGACLEFQGIVRELEQGSSVPGLFYEAYEPMARRVLERHLGELVVLHPCAAVFFVHRLGWVPVGEASLFIRVLSAHRGEALAYLAASVDRLKQDVPIWKRPAAPEG